MHKNNKHQNDYDFDILTQTIPDLEDYVFTNKFGSTTIDFANPEAVKCLNKALLKTYYSIDYWEFPDAHLCPPIPGRVDYTHHLADLFKNSKLIKLTSFLGIKLGRNEHNIFFSLRDT